MSIDAQVSNAKADAGKPKISLVPMEILNDIARVREYGIEKYHDPDNWKKVDYRRYVDAMLRHSIQFAENPESLDEESGLPHLWHIACNVAFLCHQLRHISPNAKESIYIYEALRRAGQV